MAEPTPSNRSGIDRPAADPRSTGRPAARRSPFARLFPNLAGDPLDVLAQKARQARAALVFERLWPALLPMLSVVAVFVSLAWLGVFAAMADWLRLGLVALFVLALGASVVPLVRLRLPRRRDALDRLERDSGFDHRPLLALSDDLAAGGDDAFSRALWQAHLARVGERLSAIRIGLPSPRVDRRDRWGLRIVVFLLFIVGLSAAGPDPVGRIADALRLPLIPGPTIRIDAWVTPPAYTDRPPVFLTEAGTGRQPGEAVAAPLRTEARVPEASLVTVRLSGLEAGEVRWIEGPDAPDGEIAADGGVTVPPLEPAETANARPAERRDGAPAVPVAYEFPLENSGRLAVVANGEVLRSWRFTVDPDQPPTIALIEEPGQTGRGAFQLAYQARDDYRLVGADAKFDAPLARAMPPLAGAILDGEPRPLIEPPDFPLTLPRRGVADDKAETYRDLAAHPYAGTRLTMRLEARDDAGNIGRTAPVEVTIPARPFTDPVAKMLVEQRRILALDARTQGFVADMLDTVTMHADTTIEDSKIFLGLRHGRNLVASAASDDDLRAAMDYLWEMALAIDGGDASLAEQRLREARERLREALQNGASDEEIARLTQELRDALNEYMQALAEQMRNNPQAAQPQQMPPNAQQISPQQLEDMINRMEELSKLGDKDAAEQLLSQLDRMLENMQAMQGQPQQPSGDSPMNQAMDELGRMIQEQQRLMNETFNMSPDGRQPQQGQRGQPQQGQQGQQGEQGQMTPEQRAEAMQRLQEGQAELQRRLGELQEQMRQNGMEPGDQLGEAGDAMGRAEQQLGQGEPGGAAGEQGQALEQLRQGAQQLAEQMGDQPGEEGGRGQGQARQSPQDDPLGRPQRRDGPDYGDSVRVPGEIDIQRARRVLDELRRRFSEDYRPKIELDYLERLLRSE
ncbi:TIGR02302 family protein [Methylobrevis albus]|uniref:TIGR02302 family protein n=1 Tax=Methylobrevis albus TaxID=2793297 RepID=A0A931HYD9_9HYPH|nr:TIGR02302 family protein [Methylobrevis albus]MBH0236415.1 TIGR02302 family protein [Methylobrevis albus]